MTSWFMPMSSYSDRLSQLLRGRIAFFRQLQNACSAASQDVSRQALALQIMEELSRFEQREISTLNAIEAMMVKRLGDELSIPVPERSALYARKAAEHARKVAELLGRQRDTEIYALLVGGSYDGWTFEFGELRESRRGGVTTDGEGVVSMPFELSLIGSITRNHRTIDMTIYVTIDHAGKLMIAGLR